MNTSYLIRAAALCRLYEMNQRALTIGGSITVQLTSSLFCLYSGALLTFNDQLFYLSGQIQTSQKMKSAA